MTRRPPLSRRPDAAGQAGEAVVELVAGLALLLAPITALAVTLPTWAETRYAAEAAAAEAARLAAHTGDTAAAEDLAAQIAANHGLHGKVDAEVAVPTDDAGRPARHGEATARVTAQVPAVDLPALGAVGGWPLTRTHHEPLDPYRGLEADG